MDKDYVEQEPTQAVDCINEPERRIRIGNNKKPYRKFVMRAKAKAARQARKASRRIG